MFGSLKIFCAQQALLVGNQHLGLRAVDVIVELLTLKFRFVPAVGHGDPVQPDGRHRPVIREQFRDLRLHKIEIDLQIVRRARGIARFGRVVFGSCLPAPFVIVGRVRVLPVPPVRIVQAQSQAAPITRCGQLFDQIAPGRGIDAVELRFRRFKQAKRIVVPRGDVDVFHLAINGKLRDAFRVEPLGPKIAHQLRVFGDGDELAQLHPLVPSQQGVQAIVQEQAVTRLAKPRQRRSTRIAAVKVGVVFQIIGNIAHDNLLR